MVTKDELGKGLGPKPKGGRRGHRHPNSLAALEAHRRSQWPKGVSGNPGGHSKSLTEIMRLAREACPEAIETLTVIMRDTDATRRDRINACIALLDRGLGRPIVPVYKGENAMPLEMVAEAGADGVEVTALTRAAKHSDRVKALEAELARLKRTDAEIAETRAHGGDQNALSLLMAVKAEKE